MECWSVTGCYHGWFTAPIETPGSGNRTAYTTYQYWDRKFGRIATGVGKGDAAFVSGWQTVGKLATGNVEVPYFLITMNSGVPLADMDGNG